MEARKAGSVSWVVGMGVGMGEGVVKQPGFTYPCSCFPRGKSLPGADSPNHSGAHKHTGPGRALEKPT